MAVTLTPEVLAHALRITQTPSTALSTGEAVTVSRLLGAVTALVDNYAANSPTHVSNEAAIRLAGWLYDQPPGRQNADALGLSGARSLLSPYRERRALSLTGGDDGPGAATPGLSGLDVTAVTNLILALVPGLIADYVGTLPPDTAIFVEQTIRYGYSDDDQIDVADIIHTTTGNTFALENPPPTGHLVMWRSDADGGDFSYWALSVGGANQRGGLGDAIDLELDGVPGKAVISNASLRLDHPAFSMIFVDGPEPPSGGDGGDATAAIAAHAAIASAHHAKTPPGIPATTIQGYIRTHDGAGDAHDDLRAALAALAPPDRAAILALFPALTGTEDNRIPSQNIQQSRNLIGIGTGDALDVGELVTGTFNVAEWFFLKTAHSKEINENPIADDRYARIVTNDNFAAIATAAGISPDGIRQQIVDHAAISAAHHVKTAPGLGAQAIANAITAHRAIESAHHVKTPVSGFSPTELFNANVDILADRRYVRLDFTTWMDYDWILLEFAGSIGPGNPQPEGPTFWVRTARLVAFSNTLDPVEALQTTTDGNAIYLGQLTQSGGQDAFLSRYSDNTLGLTVDDRTVGSGTPVDAMPLRVFGA